MKDIYLSGAAAAALSISLFIETSSWWIRVVATKDNFGYYISRSNIYLYGGRFFSLVFGLFLAFQIENGLSPALISITLAISFLMAFLLQILLLSKKIRRFFILKISIVLDLPPASDKYEERSVSRHDLDAPLFVGTLAASVSFSLGLSVPPLFASIFIDSRLVISNLGQLINAVGMIIILFFVDQKLYLAFDNNNLYRSLVAYSKARSLAFLLIGVVFLFIFGDLVNE